MVDTASVIEAMWDSTLREGLRSKFERDIGKISPDVRRLTAFLAGLHDIGKACPAFQAKCLTMKTRLENAGLCFRPGISRMSSPRMWG